LFFKALHAISNWLALALLVTAIFADDAHDTVAPDNLAVTTDTLD